MLDQQAIFAIVRDLIMGVVTILVFLWGRDRKQTQEAVEKDFKLRDQRIDAMEKLLVSSDCKDEIARVDLSVRAEEIARMTAIGILQAQVHNLDNRTTALEVERGFTKRKTDPNV